MLEQSLSWQHCFLHISYSTTSYVVSSDVSCMFSCRQLYRNRSNNSAFGGAYMCALATTSLIACDADSASAYFSSSDFFELIIRIVLWHHAMCSVSHALCCRQGGRDPIWWCSNTLEEKRAFNSQHSFREDQRMLLTVTAHSSDSTNSLFKARATTHRR